MLKNLFLILFIAISVNAISQEVTRIKIKGKITASKGEDVEGINPYNKSSKKGTITSETGEFELKVAENDRVFISAMQFQRFTVIIDNGIIENKKMYIYLNPVVNQLDEVLIRPYDISGNIVADVKRINVTSVSNEWDLSYETLEFEYEFSADAQTSVKGNKSREAYHNGQEQYGGDILGLASMIADIISPSKKKKSTKKEEISETDMITNAVQKRFGNNYISKTFKIPEDKVNEFIYYVEENGIDRSLLRPENEFILIDYLHLQSRAYLLQSQEK